MIFFSLVFLVFFSVASICVQIAPNTKWQHRMIFLCNIIFYAYGDCRFLFLLILIIAICYSAAYWSRKDDNRIWINIGILGCILTLFIYKYANFFAQSFVKAFYIQSQVTLKIILPLGLSFYLFQAMSYLFDVKQGRIEAERDFAKLGAYLSFFPQIMSGPIVKAHDFLPQMERVHRIKKENVYKGLQLFMIGLTKKLVFADRIGVAVSAVYVAPLAYNSVSIWGAIIGYSLQVYCDFSGYSDMAIGIATVWDFDLGKNFNVPYIARNPSEFWRRWHISLSSWFRDYVYIPLGGSRRGTIRTCCNLFLTMILSGIWHGANMTFIIWGCLHGIASVLNKLWNTLLGKSSTENNPFITMLCIIINNLVVSIGWVIFRSDDMEMAFEMLSGLFRFQGITYINVYVVCYGILIGLIHMRALHWNHGNAVIAHLNLDKMKDKVVLSVWIFVILMLMYCGNSAFIYAKF